MDWHMGNDVWLRVQRAVVVRVVARRGAQQSAALRRPERHGGVRKLHESKYVVQIAALVFTEA